MRGPSCEARRAPALLPGSTDDHRTWAERTARANRDGVPAPKSGGPLGRARAIANRAFAETTVVEPDGHGNGHGNGNGNGNGNGMRMATATATATVTRWATGARPWARAGQAS